MMVAEDSSFAILPVLPSGPAGRRRFLPGSARRAERDISRRWGPGGAWRSCRRWTARLSCGTGERGHDTTSRWPPRCRAARRFQVLRLRQGPVQVRVRGLHPDQARRVGPGLSAPQRACSGRASTPGPAPGGCRPPGQHRAGAGGRPCRDGTRANKAPARLLAKSLLAPW